MTDSNRLPVESERAQLLLVGAVAIGLILLGLVVVYNTILFTETKKPAQQLDDSADTRVLRDQVVNDTRTLVRAIHEDTGWECDMNDSDLQTAIENNITNLSQGQSYSQAVTGVKYVGLTKANATCGVSNPSNVTVTYNLVVETPETSSNVTISEAYNSSRGLDD